MTLTNFFKKTKTNVSHFFHKAKKTVSHVSNFIENSKPYLQLYGHHLDPILEKYNVHKDIRKGVGKALEIAPHIHGINDILRREQPKDMAPGKTPKIKEYPKVPGNNVENYRHLLPR